MTTLEEPEETSTSNEAIAMREKPQEEPTKKKRKRRPPLVPWKKPKDMPRRPLSAYNIFFKEQRERIMKETAAASAPEIVAKKSKRKSNKPAGIGFANLARTIARNWKDLDAESKTPYEAQASEEKNRYNKEMIVWRAKQKKKKEEASSQGVASRSSAVDSTVRGTDEADFVSSENKSHHDSSYDDPIPIPHSTAPVEERPLPLESPKKSRRAFSSNVARRNSDMTGLTPIRVPDYRNAVRWPEEYGQQSHSDSALLQHQLLLAGEDTTRHTPGRISMGMGHMNPYQEHHSNPFHGFDVPPNMDPWSGYMQPFNGLHHHQMHQPVARRYTWSGANLHSTTRYQTLRRNSDEKSGMHQSSPTLYPVSRFEVEKQASSIDQHPREEQTREKPSSSIYPETWFEVHDANGGNIDLNHEPIWYSPEGDLTGKLPPGKTSSRRSRGSDEGKPRREGKSNDEKQARSVQEHAHDTPTIAFHPVIENREGKGDDGDPIVESSLQVLGLQLDDETVDFITKLRFNGGAGESSMEEDNS